MDAFGLMLGDWVCINGEEEYFGQIQRLEYDRIDIGGRHGDPDIFVPIPLTDEMLKLNCWLEPFDEGLWFFGQIVVRKTLHHGYLFGKIHVNNVHDLQHILHDFGYHSAAADFKIKEDED